MTISSNDGLIVSFGIVVCFLLGAILGVLLAMAWR